MKNTNSSVSYNVIDTAHYLVGCTAAVGVGYDISTPIGGVSFLICQDEEIIALIYFLSLIAREEGGSAALDEIAKCEKELETRGATYEECDSFNRHHFDGDCH